MLNPERAQEQLKEFAVTEGEERRLKRIATLPKALHPSAYGLSGYQPDGKAIKDYKQQREAKTDAVDKLTSFPAADRILVFTACCPHLGPQMEHAWQLFERLPYQGHGMRKAFRAPGSPQILASSRHAWLDILLRVTGSYEQEVTWFAAWAPYLGWYADSLGIDRKS